MRSSESFHTERISASAIFGQHYYSVQFTFIVNFIGILQITNTRQTPRRLTWIRNELRTDAEERRN